MEQSQGLVVDPEQSVSSDSVWLQEQEAIKIMDA
jgi:hypothetical protein